MTVEETKKLLITINALYPAWTVENPEATVAAWHWELTDYPADAIMNALHRFVKNGNSGFAPSVSQLIGSIGFVDKLRPETRKFIQELDSGVSSEKLIEIRG